MAKLTSTLIVRMLDQVSKPARSAARSLMGIGDAASRVGKDASLSARIGSAIEKNNVALANAQGQLVGAVAGFYALKKAIGGPVVIAAEFESSMNRVAAVSGATEAELSTLTEQARELGRSTRYTASQAADAQNFLAMAGFKVNDILGAMPGTLQLAAAAQMDLGDAADIVSNVLTGYSKDVEELAHVNDVLVKTFTSSNTDLRQLGDAMKYVAPIASAAGVQFEEAAAALGLMGNAGIQGSMAGTSLRGAIGRILNPTKSVVDAIDDLNMSALEQADMLDALDGAADDIRAVLDEVGLSFTDTTGKLLPLNEIIEQLGPHAENAGLFLKLFGKRAGPAMSALVSQGADALRDLTAELENSGGTAERIAEMQMRGTKGLFLQLKSAFEDVQIAIGQGLAPALNKLMENLIPILNRLSEFVSDNPKLVAALIGTAGGFVALKVALTGMKWLGLMARGGVLSVLHPVIKLGKWAKTAAAGNIALQGSLATMSGMKFGGLAKAATGFGGIAKAVPIIGGVLGGGLSAPVVIAIAAIAGAGATIYKYWDHISSFVSGFASALAEELAPAIETVKPYLTWLEPVGKAVAEGWQLAKDILAGVFDWIRNLFKREVLSEEEKAEWEKSGSDAARRMIDAIKKVFQLTNIVGWAWGLGKKIGGAIGEAAAGALNRAKSWWSGSSGGVEARAMGGPTRRGQTYLVGEEGPELWQSPGHGRIIPNDETMRMLRDFRRGMPAPAAARSSGSNVTVHAPITITGVADAKEAAREVARVFVETVGNSLRGVHADVGVE